MAIVESKFVVESSKIIMQYISAVSGKSADVQRVKDRMLASNPLLEAFGNAKTVNNNNSSRFGKYMVILFNDRGDPVGGNVTNYLLEKSRVVGPSQGERNFHFFYQMCKGMTETQRSTWQIYSADSYYYLFSSGCFEVENIDDQRDFNDVMDAMKSIGFSKQDRDEVFRVVSMVLWLGNMTFTEDNRERSSVVERDILDLVASFLGVNAEAVERVLCERQISTGAGSRLEIISKHNSAVVAANTRDSLAKALYSKMFDHIVDRVNESIQSDNVQGNHIGVLDIYGFEIFQHNSFEQLCINFVNERLQQIFIDLTLKSEQEEYRREGIAWKEIKFFNNKPVCELIENRPGVLSVCDDACHTSKTDAMFVNDISNQFSSHKFIQCGSRDFTITHYAGVVRYEIDGFLEKNKDSLVDDIVELLQSSSSRFVSSHGWMDMVVSRGQKRRPPTVGKTFNRQVHALMGALSACTPHYIRCIKPNTTKKPNDFDSNYTKYQVRYLGLLENIRVRRAGYASRMTFERFLSRYAILSDRVVDNISHNSSKDQAISVLKDIGLTSNDYAVGKTKIFIRDAFGLFTLEDLLERRLCSAATNIQKLWKTFKSTKFFLKVKADSYDVVKGRKERRSNSITRMYTGDYLDFSYNPVVKGLLMLEGSEEKVIFADRTRVVILKGKQSFFKKIVGTLGSRSHTQSISRFLMLTAHALYSFVFDQDPATERTRAKLYFRIPLNSIASVTLSPFQDNFIILHFLPSSATTDVLINCKRKTEFIGLLVHSFQTFNGRSLDVQFGSVDSITQTRKKKVETIGITFVKDESCQQGAKIVPNDKDLEIHVASGIPADSVPAPYRPADIDPSLNVRDQVKALYDFQGNGVDELTFTSGDILNVIDPETDGWYRCEVDGQMGYVPGTYVEVYVTQPNLVSPAAFSPSPSPREHISFNHSLTINETWEKVMDEDSGYHYYYNSITGASQWEVPKGYKE